MKCRATSSQVLFNLLTTFSSFSSNRWTAHKIIKRRAVRLEGRKRIPGREEEIEPGNSVKLKFRIFPQVLYSPPTSFFPFLHLSSQQQYSSLIICCWV